MNKKKTLIILGALVIVILMIIGLFFLSLTPVSKSNESVSFTINKGDSKEVIVDNLKDAELIKSKYAAFLYIILSGKKNIQAGLYELSRDMSTTEIIDILVNGDIVDVKRPSVMITFVEGITLKEYLKLLADKTELDYDTILKEINSHNYLKKLIDDYWFLTEDILDEDIYFALEGYLYPETYEFYKDTTLDQAIRKMLNVTDKKLTSIKDDIKKSNLTVHELLTIASIVEKEALTYEDRTKVAQVVFKRLDLNMSLGMDVTAYYGVQKDLKDNNITVAELNDDNPYNTRLVTFKGLPVGPICNPSLESINAVLNPADTDYIYFFADIYTGKVYFTSDINEFESFKRIYG